MIKISRYNIEWFTKLFDANNNFATSNDPDKHPQITERLQAIAKVLKEIDADVVGIVEAPNTTIESAKWLLTENWCFELIRC